MFRVRVRVRGISGNVIWVGRNCGFGGTIAAVEGQVCRVYSRWTRGTALRFPVRVSRGQGGGRTCASMDGRARAFPGGEGCRFMFLLL